MDFPRLSYWRYEIFYAKSRKETYTLLNTVVDENFGVVGGGDKNGLRRQNSYCNGA